MKRLLLTVLLCILGLPVYAAAPTQPPASTEVTPVPGVTTAPRPVCTFPDDAAVVLNVKHGDVATMLGYVNNPNSLTLGQARAFADVVTAQMTALEGKYCK